MPAAFWNGPYVAEVAGRTLLPGDEHEVTEADLLSNHWIRKPATKHKAAATAEAGDD